MAACNEIGNEIASASGLRDEDRETVRKLVRVWNEKRPRNMLRERYYLGHVRIKDLGISMPKSLAAKVDPRVDWPRKAVHALADRSILNGFCADDDDAEEALRDIYAGNQMDSLYRKALVCELKHCCSFWTVTDDGDGRPIVSVYPATASSAIWDDAGKSIRAGLVVVESKECGQKYRRPSVVELYLPDAVATIRKGPGGWEAEYAEHSRGRTLMEPMAHAATLERPFGTSRITRSVMSITDDAIRQRARMEIAAESATLPQMWLLGTYKRTIDDSNRYDAAMGAINEITKDEDGDTPTLWQSAQLQMAPLTEYLRSLACQMSSVTNVPVSFFGVSNDNPSSSDAIAASLEPLVIDAKNLNRDNARALRNVAYMALAIENGTDFAAQEGAGLNVNPRFMSPAYPSVVSLSDAVLKQVQAIPKLAESDVMLELLDYTDEQMQRINSDAKRAKAGAAVLSLLSPTEGDGGDTAQPAR